MPEVDQVVLWPNEEIYPAFVAVCEGGVQPTYADFVAVAQPMLEQMQAAGHRVVKVDPDPDQMALWCRANFGNIKSKARAAYAAMVALEEPAADDSVH